MDKQHILNEIRRTAVANGGVALGLDRFLSETGIKYSDWRGKYWARWSDAIIEAGFEPNELNAAFDDSEILWQLATLTKKLGRYPTNSEMRLERNGGNSSFPSHNVVARLGRKEEVRSRLRDFCESKSEFHDVLAFLQHAEDRAESHKAIASSEGKDGFVYLIKSGRHYKIGFTNDLIRRGKEISIELPERAEVIHVIATDDPSGIEVYWHRRFKDKRVNGEWFLLSLSDVKAFRRRKYM